MEITGTVNASGMCIGIIAARFNSMVTEALVRGAISTIVQHGGDEQSISVVRVPGAFEVPVVAARMAQSGEYDALIAIAAVIRGETGHYDQVANNATSGIMAVEQETGVVIGNGILTCDTIEQALNRAGLKVGNAGSSAALAAIETADVLRQLPKSQS